MPISRRRPQLLLSAAALLVLIGAAALALGPAVFGDDDDPTPTPLPPVAPLDLAAPLGWDGLARGPLLHLVAEPVQPGENVFSVRVTGPDGTPQPQPAETAVELTLTSFALEAAPIVVTAEPDGVGGFATTPVAMADEGWWEVAVRLTRPGQPEARESFYLILPDPNAYGTAAVPLPAGDPAAEAVYERGRASFTGLHRVRYGERMASGSGDVALTAHAVSDGTDGRPPASSAETFNAAIVRVGEETWVRTRDGQWLAGSSAPFIMPAGWDREWVGATGFALGPVQEIAGESAQIVTFFVPEQEGLSAAWYAFWVGTESGNVHRVAMISRAHYMVTDYGDFDGPIAIEPPVTDAATPTTPT